jgi:hypothetical protein
MSSYE